MSLEPYECPKCLKRFWMSEEELAWIGKCPFCGLGITEKNRINVDEI